MGCVIEPDQILLTGAGFAEAKTGHVHQHRQSVPMTSWPCEQGCKVVHKDSLAAGDRERLIDIRNDIGGVLDAHRQADEIIADSPGSSLLGAETTLA